MNKFFNLIIGLFLGYFSYKKICIYGNNKNECPLRKINRFNTLHIHHWIIHLFLGLWFRVNPSMWRV